MTGLQNARDPARGDYDWRRFASALRSRQFEDGRALRAIADEIGVTVADLSRAMGGQIVSAGKVFALCDWLGICPRRFYLPPEFIASRADPPPAAAGAAAARGKARDGRSALPAAPEPSRTSTIIRRIRASQRSLSRSREERRSPDGRRSSSASTRPLRRMARSGRAAFSTAPARFISAGNTPASETGGSNSSARIGAATPQEASAEVDTRLRNERRDNPSWRTQRALRHDPEPRL